MQLAGPHMFGPPKDRDAALAVLRETVASGINHIDTSDFYGPHVTNQLIREALFPYPDDLVIVTKAGLHALKLRLRAVLAKGEPSAKCQGSVQRPDFTERHVRLHAVRSHE